MRWLFTVLAVVVLFSAFAAFAVAHGAEGGMDEHGMTEEVSGPTLEARLQSLAIKVVYSAAALLALLALIAYFNKKAFENNRRNALKILVFASMIAVIVVASIFIGGSTIYLNSSSRSGGPVHWHADFEVWNCGEKLSLVSPEGLSNRIGSSTFHVHGDDRVHVEGVVTNYAEVTLKAFFATLGGSLSKEWLHYPTDSGMVEMHNGNLCDGRPGKLQVFLYQARNPDDRNNPQYEQMKLSDSPNYVLSPYPNVPSGDCIIFEFGEEKEKTDRICSSLAYGAHAADEMGEEMEEEMGEHGHEDEDEHADADAHVAAVERYGYLKTFGPADAPHLHAVNTAAFASVDDIARHPDDVPKLQQSDIVKISLISKEVISEIAPGITFHYWTFNNTVPGPMLRVKERDMVELTLANDKSSSHNHSIDLHAVTGPGGGAALTQVAPGESKTIRFKALNPGLYVYHCATPNVPTHVANGMYGLILVEPASGLPPVDKEFYVMQGELYTKGAIGEKGFQEFDSTKMLYENPEYVVFNGRVKALADNPLKANVGEKVRLYVGNGGVSLVSSFHVIGEIFDTVYPEAATTTTHNVQTTVVPAGGAAIVDFELDTKGNYVLVDHALARLDKGAWGVMKVEGKENPEILSEIR